MPTAPVLANITVDGKKIKADDGKRFTGEVKELKEKKSRIEKKIERILHHTLDERPEFKARSEKILDYLEREKTKIQTFLDEVEKGAATANGKVSLTDRDACMVKDKDSKYIGYNCQSAVDEKAQAIVGTEVFNEASDRGLLQPMIETVKNQVPQDPTKTEIGFDTGYFSSENIRYCHDQGLDVYLPEDRG